MRISYGLVRYGFVQTQEPNWLSLSKLKLPAKELRGFKHRKSDVWLMGFAGKKDRGCADPAELLGLGTRDLYDRFDDKFEVCYPATAKKSIVVKKSNVKKKK